MQIAEVHAQMRTDIRNLGPKVDPKTGQVRLQNRGVRNMWLDIKAQEAYEREQNVRHDRTKAHRKAGNKCPCNN